MNDKRYRYILYTIALVIVATIGIQIYWNYKNYLTNKQQLINDVQVSLDKAVDDYYAALAKKTTIGFSFDDARDTDGIFEEGSKFSNILRGIDEKNKEFKNLDSIDVSAIKGVTVVRGFIVDSMMDDHSAKHKSLSIDSFKAEIKTLKQNNDSLDLSNIKLLTSKIVVSINNDTLDVRKVNTLLIEDFNRKAINLDHHLAYFTTKPDPTLNKGINALKDKLPKKDYENYALFVESKSLLLPAGSALKLSFANETFVILKRAFGGILISTLLILAVISSLFYLLKIIKHQKQLAVVKNDLISNITHEFKTPIATISAALEGINNFNAIADKEKTKRYIDMSANQISKLNVMVEKLLETATLDSDSLNLNLEDVDIISLLTTLGNRYQMNQQDKTIQTSFKVERLLAKVDVFHFENAINNILDNAIKYGGDLITIDVIPKNERSAITISDNGKGINKTNKDRIFEKFYRVPKGNTHDVKGFGIGLYYTKSIIEKHGGTIVLDLNNALTTFKIELQNV